MNERAVLLLDDWGGRSEQPVTIVGETPKRYRIASCTGTAVRLAGRDRYLEPGDTALVPKSAVRRESAMEAEPNKPWPGWCQNCGAKLDPPDATACDACGTSDYDEGPPPHRSQV